MADKKKNGVRFSKYETDSVLENEGVWLDYETPFRVKVARINNNKFQEFFIKSDGSVDAPGDVNADEMKQAVSQTVLLDWEFMLDDDDREVPYSSDEAFNRFNLSSEFYNRIIVMSNARENYRTKKKEKAGKNS